MWFCEKYLGKGRKHNREEKDAKILARNNRGNTEVKGRGAWGEQIFSVASGGPTVQTDVPEGTLACGGPMSKSKKVRRKEKAERICYKLTAKSAYHTNLK